LEFIEEFMHGIKKDVSKLEKWEGLTKGGIKSLFLLFQGLSLFLKDLPSKSDEERENAS